MTFNSIAFAVFLPVVFAAYWALARFGYRVQNILLMLASYVFYGWWDYRFLSLVVLSAAVDYTVGRFLQAEDRPRIRKRLLGVSVAFNLGLLGTFKYFNFFIESLGASLEMAGLPAPSWGLRLVLPIGISFYTFQTLSYVIDVYRRKIAATDDWVSFFAFVGFFPQLVAGPIERAAALLPQFQRVRDFDLTRAKDGLRQMLWGLFKKVVIADTLAESVDIVFAQSATASSFNLLAGVFFFAIQIYCDFSGYSDIAIGTARLFGFSLMRNFAFPYFSRDIAEFWRRWHISLSSWFRDYLYIPLGGSGSTWQRRVRNLVITFGVSGLWHGASWTFVVWGLLNALYYVPLVLLDRHRQHVGTIAPGRLLPGVGDLARITSTFVLTMVAWVFFRADSLGHAFSYLAGIATSVGGEKVIADLDVAYGVVLSGAFLSAEWVQRGEEHALAVHTLPVSWRWSIYSFVSVLIALLGAFESSEFIYFQF